LANSPVLELSGVDAFYGDSHVLHGVGFAVDEGRLVGLLGRNGAGKSTCMSTIIGFLRCRAGRVALFGDPINGLSPEAIVRRGVALVPQGRRIFRSLSVHENLRVAARAPRRNGATPAWDAARVYKVFPRLAERQSQVAGSLSGGEQQMLAIGRALMGNPRVLLLDEPSEGLAPQIVAEVGRIIARLKSDGLSILLVEQNIKLTLALADNVVIMNTGRIVFRGTSAELAGNHTLISQQLGVF
jgi:branched-chain amino acid transport system ATP-binding protein